MSKITLDVRGSYARLLERRRVTENLREQGKLKRNVQYDAYYNSDTLEWLEPACRDPYCFFCKDRPAKAPKE